MRKLFFLLFIATGLTFVPSSSAQILAPIVGGATHAASNGFQSKTCTLNNTNATSANCTWSANPSTGDNVFCIAHNYFNTPFTITDSASNTYSANGSMRDLDGGSGLYGQNFYLSSLPGSISTMTVSAASAFFMGIQCASFRGYSGGPDGSEGFAALASGTSQSTSVTTSTNTVLIMAAFSADVSTVLTPGSGFTAISDLTPGQQISMMYKLSSSIGSNTCDFTSNVTDGLSVMCQAYK